MFCKAKPLNESPIAIALGLQGKTVESISINLFSDGAAYASAVLLVDEEIEGRIVQVLRGFDLLPRPQASLNA